jgi:hypothetical protein
MPNYSHAGEKIGSAKQQENTNRLIDANVSEFRLVQISHD